MNAMGDVDMEFIKELASEILPEGLLAEERPGSSWHHRRLALEHL